MTGLTHLYYGNGKGKTTAAIGLAVRAAGNGMQVVFVQFLKGTDTGELSVLQQTDRITVIRNERSLGFLKNMTTDEIHLLRKMHNANFHAALDYVREKKADMLILDEICAAYRHNVIDKALVAELLCHKPDPLELVLTGREPDDLFLQKADYITHMCCERHPYETKGISARRGIEY